MLHRHGYCRECARIYARISYAKNPEKQREYARKYYLGHSEKIRERIKQYYRDHREQVRMSKRLWDIAHPEIVAASKAKYYPQKLIRNLIRYRTMQGLMCDWNYVLWENLKKSFGNKCLCCGRAEGDVELTVDHVQPVYTGGSNLLENLQPLCKSCNSHKGTKTIDYRLDYI